MNNNDSDKKKVPVLYGVLVVRYNEKGDPYPVAQIHIDAANKIAFTGDASKGYAPLLTATRKCGMKLARQSIEEALKEKRGLCDLAAVLKPTGPLSSIDGQDTSTEEETGA